MTKFRYAFLFILFLFILRPSYSQKNDIGFFVNGNFNSPAYIYLLNYKPPQPVVSSYKSSVGIGLEYRYWLTSHIATGTWVEMNPSDGHLYTSALTPYLGIWPIRRYEFAAPVTYRFYTRHKLKPYISAGPGVVATQSLVENSGWSKDTTIFTGVGGDYQLIPRLSLSAGITNMVTRPGCYGDPTCGSSWGLAEDGKIGIRYEF